MIIILKTINNKIYALSQCILLTLNIFGMRLMQFYKDRINPQTKIPFMKQHSSHRIKALF